MYVEAGNTHINKGFLIHKNADNELEIILFNNFQGPTAGAGIAINGNEISVNESLRNDIEQNTSNIAENTSNIETNRSNIETNTNAITFNKINVQSENPTGTQEQDKLYINSTNNTLYRYNVGEETSGEWISVGGGGGDSIINTAGQTFAQLMTEQPRKFITDNFDIRPSSSTTNIVLTWNYNNIVPTDDNYLKLASGSKLKQRTLPYINKIHIQYNKDVTSDNWTDFTTVYSNIASPITIENNESYKDYTRITIKKDPNDPWNNFSVRIYGENDNSADNSENAIVISNLNFQKGVVPPKPDPFNNDNDNEIETTDNDTGKYFFTKDFKVTNTENSNEPSTARINRYKTTYSVNESLRSTHYDESESDYTIESDFGNNTYDANKGIPINIGNNTNSLRTGTSYNYQVQLGNNVTAQDIKMKTYLKNLTRSQLQNIFTRWSDRTINFSSIHQQHQ